MARIKRTWNDDFNDYMEDIVKHQNYAGLPIERKHDGTLSWFAFGKGKIGMARKKWVEEKAYSYGLRTEPGIYAKIMRNMHPTKIHVCQICGSKMSINYYYPSVNFLKSIEREFGLMFDVCDNIKDIWTQIYESTNNEYNIKKFFEKKFNLKNIENKTKDEIIAICEQKCREDGKSLLGPGVMSNFPDRFDGFHTYNRCCRGTQDTGRSKINLKSYTKDRRAYEYWSDGNLHAADMFMGSQFFKDLSADHIGPISLGFIHDPHYIRPMTSSDNSTKRDHLLVNDIKNILHIEARCKVYPMSWYSSEIWEYIKANFENNEKLVPTVYRDLLKQNMANYMFILKTILDTAEERGKEFLVNKYIEPKYECFLYTYIFDNDGNIIKKSNRHFTERSKNEIIRFTRIAFNAIYEYGEKENRRQSNDLIISEMENLKCICDNINNNSDFTECKTNLEILISNIQRRLIKKV